LTTTALDRGRRAGRREWVGLGVIALPCLLYSMDLTVLFLAVPELSAELEPSSSQLLWISDIYGFLLAGFLITMGTLGDRIGRRRLLLIGAAAFGAASVLAAFSSSAEMLIFARALLGVAGATLAPSTLSLIRNMFLDADQRTIAVSVWITSFSVGAAIGPLVGGVLLHFFWWGSVFLAAVPVMALLLVLGPLLLPEYRDPEAGRLDLVSAALSLAAVLALIYGLKTTAQDGLAWTAAAAIALGLVVGFVFLRRQRLLPYPLLDVRLFRSSGFSIAVAAICASVFVVGGIFFFLAQYLQLVRGQAAVEAALWLLPATGGLVAGSMLAPVLTRRMRAGSLLAGGLAVTAAGVAALTQTDVDSGLVVAVLGSGIMGCGAGLVGTLATDLIIGAAPPERAGAASAISETGAELGGALGIAVLGSIGAAVYRRDLDDTIPPGLSSEQAGVVRDTLGGALAVAEGLPARLSEEVLGAARDAFVHGLQLAAATTALAVAGLAILAWTFLRGAGQAPDHELEAAPSELDR
jgi:MFS transporter, DHA2 family, multidrug resistance protein